MSNTTPGQLLPVWWETSGSGHADLLRIGWPESSKTSNLD